MYIGTRLPSTFTGLALYAVLASGSLIVTPESEIATFSDSVPRSPEVDLRRREPDAPVTIDNIVWPTGFPNLVPTKAVHIALGPALSPSPLRVAETPVILEKRDDPVTVNGVVYPTGYPNLVPTSTVDLATDSTFTTTAIATPTNWTTSTVTITQSGSSSSTAVLRTEAVSVECVADISGTAYTTACPTTSATTTYTPVTIDGVVYPTGFPNLVPTTTVHLSTEETAAATAAQGDTTEAKKEQSAGLSLRPPMFGFIKAVLRALP